jgi:hypothetical protein
MVLMLAWMERDMPQVKAELIEANPTTKELSEAELERATGGSHSSGIGTGKASINSFSITRKIDRSSPIFFGP